MVCRRQLGRNTFTPIADHKRFPFPYPEKRDKKQVEIAVHPLQPRLGQSASLADPGGIVYDLGFGRNSGNQEHE